MSNKIAKAAAAERLRQNAKESGLLNIGDVVVVLEGAGSNAAVLDEPNRAAFDALASRFDEGAVAANLHAAAAVEDQAGLGDEGSSVVSRVVAGVDGVPSAGGNYRSAYTRAIAQQSAANGSPSRAASAASRKVALAATRSPPVVSRTPGAVSSRKSRARGARAGGLVAGREPPADSGLGSGESVSSWPAGSRAPLTVRLPSFSSAFFFSHDA